MNDISTLEFGHKKEEQAEKYLASHGMRLKEKNYRCKMGEIDLIMYDKDNTLVFVEVRYRNRDDYGGGLESVDNRKQKKLIRTATYYLQQKNLLDKIPCRFDVVAISDIMSETTFEWIKDAFWVKY